MRRLAFYLNAACALASVAGVIVYAVHSWRAEHSEVLSVLWVTMMVIVPYTVHFFALRMASSLLTSSIAFGAVFICVAIAVVLYADAFTTTDPKYVIAIWLAIISQSAIATVALAVIAIIRHLNQRPPSNSGVQRRC